MLEVLYATGIRVSELINLNIDDVSITGGFIRSRVRREDENHSALSRGCIRRFMTYIDDVRLKHAGNTLRSIRFL